MRKKQKIKILSFLFIGLIILSCNYDDGINNSMTPQTSDNFVLRKEHLKEYSKNTKLFNQINKVKSKKLKPVNATGKIVSSSDGSFSINTDFTTYIENNGKHSYTFKINRENPRYLLENLVLNSNDSLGYDAYIIQYDINEDEYNQLRMAKNINLSDKVTATNLVDESLVTNVFSKEAAIDISTMCLNTTVIAANSCPCAGHTIYDIMQNPGICICNQSFTLYPTQTIYSWGECTISTGGGGSGGGTGGTSGGGGGEDTTGNDYDGSDPSIHGNGGVSTAPTLDEDNNIIIIETPCEQLKNLSKPSEQDINQRVTELKNKITTGAKKEWGVEFMQQNQYNSTTNENYTTYSTNIKEGINDEVALSTGKDNNNGTINMIFYVGGMHTHPLDGYSMFSWGDMQALLGMYNDAVSSVKTEVTLILVCNNPSDAANPLVYALKVDDITALTTKINADWNNTDYTGLSDKKKKQKIFDELSKGYEANKSNLERHFLQFYKDYGISLYKAENDMSNWNKLTLGTGTGTAQQVNKTPCTK